MNTESTRRQAAQADLGIKTQKMQKAMDSAIQKEEKRIEAKLRKKTEIEESMSYKATKSVAVLMDKYFLDPILGFFPTVGDAFTSAFVMPAIYVSALKIKSLPLTLAVIYNVLKDMAIGMIPFLGNIIDFFYRAHRKNWTLIVGFVEDDKEIIKEVNRNATKTGILIVIFCGLIYGLIVLVKNLATWMLTLFQPVIDYIQNLF